MEGRRPVGRPKKTWSEVVEEDMKLGILNNDDDNSNQQVF